MAALRNALTLALLSGATAVNPITCSFVAHEVVTSVFYDGEDITWMVVTPESDWRSEEAAPSPAPGLATGTEPGFRTGRFAFRPVRDAYLLITAAALKGSCTQSGLAITCSDSHANVLNNWEALGPAAATPSNGTPVPPAWGAPCNSAAPSLPSGHEYVRMWAGATAAVSFRWRTPLIQDSMSKPASGGQQGQPSQSPDADRCREFGGFVCRSSGKCSPEGTRCDGQADCSDGSDEEGCFMRLQEQQEVQHDGMLSQEGARQQEGRDFVALALALAAFVAAFLGSLAAFVLRRGRVSAPDIKAVEEFERSPLIA